MARSANFVASVLLYALMPGWASVWYHEPACHRKSAGVRSCSRADSGQGGAGEVGLSGCAAGQSACSSAGGLMIAQLANDMVRDHRNSPLLLVMLNWPYSGKKISA